MPAPIARSTSTIASPQADSMWSSALGGGRTNFDAFCDQHRFTTVCSGVSCWRQLTCREWIQSCALGFNRTS
eukprot:3834109-Rhodomonas_salina.1